MPDYLFECWTPPSSRCRIFLISMPLPQLNHFTLLAMTLYTCNLTPCNPFHIYHHTLPTQLKNGVTYVPLWPKEPMYISNVFQCRVLLQLSPFVISLNSLATGPIKVELQHDAPGFSW
ncbi:uncharacterized protein C8R40DRAFT_639994 [Lentinula edodes]|uniref:uncharacterized protein n=1 Tax=Lentinula edodes TaxID=5353 RepID=UPI001E8EB386|nr:uncharacterized protein C8R40DRAFT_639994 [Lentinula edodes]KAH7870495.1 hypothetical protein C8R40DRAFT_639994 [Lentinula edodes]